MTKLNWRDASKELPEEYGEYIVQVKYGSVPTDNFCMVCCFNPEKQKFYIEAQASENTAKDYFYRDILFQVLYWAEIPLPEE